MNHPKILIVGQYFNNRSGGAITMCNLFRGWDKNNIAVAAPEIENPDFTVCDKYYQLGYLEIARKFPFNLNRRKKKIKSGIILEKKNSTSPSPNGNLKKPEIKSSYLRFLQITGLYYYKSRYRISDEFLKWIQEFSPDIIYSQLSNIELITLVEELRNKLNLPVAIHIMDDWPTTISQNGIFRRYWSEIIDKKFRHLLSKAKVLLSISESMSEEYKKRYGYNFIPFHNPIDIKFWDVPRKKNDELNGRFTMLYAGRIGLGIENCFFDIAEAISNLNKKGHNIQFDILTNSNNQILEELARFNFIKLRGGAPHTEMPGIFAAYDLLLLPNDFDRLSVNYLKYSMPTKASEYMVSGTPILLYSSIETAVTRHALKYKWAYVVPEQNREKLEFAIDEIYKKQELRDNLGNIAREYAIKNYDSDTIKNQFRNCFR